MEIINGERDAENGEFIARYEGHTCGGIDKKKRDEMADSLIDTRESRKSLKCSCLIDCKLWGIRGSSFIFFSFPVDIAEGC